MIEALILNKINFILLLSSYLIGAIPFGYIIFKFIKKKDIRNYGSGNIGATNVNRLLGKKLGFITLFLDFNKTFIPTFLTHKYLGTDIGVLCGVLSILGHLFPIWLSFKGGKGVASFIGFLLVTSWPLCIIFLLVWVLSVKIFKYSALGAIVSIIFNIILFKTTLFIQFKYKLFYWIPGEPVEFYFTLFISLLILLKHRNNIKYLLNK